MKSRLCPLYVSWLLLGIAHATGLVATVRAQVPPAPTSEPDPAPQPVNAMPALPAMTSPPPSVLPPGALATDPSRAALEDRVRQLEGMVQQLSGQMQQQMPPGGTAAPGPAPGSPTANVKPPRPVGNPAPGQSLPPNPPVSARFDDPATPYNKPGKVKFGPGFELRSDDDEFFVQFHNVTQIDYRGYQQGGQSTVHDTFAIPRQWFMFSGRITQPVGYFLSLANGFDNISMLDVFLDWTIDPKLQFRIGRMKTPFTYEFLIEPIQGLLNPERSVFFNNFGQNRDVGGMAYGRLFDSKLDYAVGIYNGARNGFLAPQDGKAVSALLNFKPFNKAEGSILENFNIGGSVFAVNGTNSPPLPQTLRTAVPTNGNGILGVPFLAFNNNVRETGSKAFWDVHAAWFYKQLAVIGEWGSGFQDYSLASNLHQRTSLPVQSFYVQAGYLLTGETRSSVGVVKPLHPFSLKDGGMGAWELVTRYQYMDVSSQVFSAGLSDANNSANRLYLTDLGFNWHMTQFVKVMFEWEHAEFNQPVLYAPNKRQLTSDMFLLRFQLYF